MRDLTLSASIGLVSIAIVCILGTYIARIPVGFDESVYLGIADQIVEGGFSERRDTFSPTPFLNNPPLAFYVASAARYVTDDFQWARVLHILVFSDKGAIWGKKIGNPGRKVRHDCSRSQRLR